MNLQDIEALQGALQKLHHQLTYHQQNKTLLIDTQTLINKFSEQNKFDVLCNIHNSLTLLMGAVCDEKGLGKLNLMLANAKVPSKYYDIFYEMLAYKKIPTANYATDNNCVYDGGEEDGAVPPPPICIDCGAHAGLISDILCHCGAEVYAFEPNIYLNTLLKRKFKNQNAYLYQKAVGSKNYKTSFLVFQGRALSQGNRIVSGIQDKETTQSYEVEVIDLCEFIELNFVRKGREIYFLKLDVEGAEFEILEKLIAKKLYKHISFIACETHEYMFENGSDKLAKIHRLIETQGIDNILLDWI